MMNEHGILLFERVLITALISLFVIDLFRLFISSWFDFGKPRDSLFFHIFQLSWIYIFKVLIFWISLVSIVWFHLIPNFIYLLCLCVCLCVCDVCICFVYGISLRVHESAFWHMCIWKTEDEIWCLPLYFPLVIFLGQVAYWIWSSGVASWPGIHLN